MIKFDKKCLAKTIYWYEHYLRKKAKNDFENNLYKKCTAKPYSFLVIDATIASHNVVCLRKNLLERI